LSAGTAVIAGQIAGLRGFPDHNQGALIEIKLRVHASDIRLVAHREDVTNITPVTVIRFTAKCAKDEDCNVKSSNPELQYEGAWARKGTKNLIFLTGFLRVSRCLRAYVSGLASFAPLCGKKPECI